MPTVKELKTLLHAKGMPVSGNKPELIARLKKKTVVATTTVPKTTGLSRNKPKSVPKNVYDKIQGRKTHDGSCLYINQQMPGKVYQKVFDKKNKTFKYKEYSRKVQMGGYELATKSYNCDYDYDTVNRFKFPSTRGTPYVIYDDGKTEKVTNVDTPINVDGSYACWSPTKKKWVQAVLKQSNNNQTPTYGLNGDPNAESFFMKPIS
jgi:hypothetical protein